jgi:hypothetical protein
MGLITMLGPSGSVKRTQESLNGLILETEAMIRARNNVTVSGKSFLKCVSCIRVCVLLAPCPRAVLRSSVGFSYRRARVLLTHRKAQHGHLATVWPVSYAMIVLEAVRFPDPGGYLAAYAMSSRQRFAS